MSSKRRRSSPLFLAGASLALLLLPSSASQPVRLTMLSAFVPFQRLGRVAGDWLRFGRRADVEELRRQNEFYRSQNVQLLSEITKYQSQVSEISVLRPLMKGNNFKLLQADVVLPSDSSPLRKSLVIAAGTRDGARKGALVVYSHQLVGRVSETGPWTSRVQLVTDPAFRAGAVTSPRTYASGAALDKRHVGVYEGRSGEKGTLKWIVGETPVEAGAYVLTTADPENGVPRGLILGRVANGSGSRNAFPRIDVEPLLNFRSLEQVTLLIDDMIK